MDLLKLGICFLVVIAIFIMRTYFKKFWDTVQLPILIVMSILSAFIVLVMLYAAYTMFSRTNFLIYEKILYYFLDAGIIVVFLWLNIYSWKKWKNDCGRKK